MFDPVDVHVGSRIRLRRVFQSMSQKQLGQKLGVTFQQVQKYEKGANRIGAGRLFRVARILDVTVGFFFEEFAPAPQPVAGEIRETPTPIIHGEIPPQNMPQNMPQNQNMHEGAELLRYFDQISDPRIRSQIINLARTLSERIKNPA